MTCAYFQNATFSKDLIWRIDEIAKFEEDLIWPMAQKIDLIFDRMHNKQMKKGNHSKFGSDLICGIGIFQNLYRHSQKWPLKNATL